MDNLWGVKLQTHFTLYNIPLLKQSYKLSRTISILYIKSHTFDSLTAPSQRWFDKTAYLPVHRFWPPIHHLLFPSEKDMVSFFPRCPGAVPPHPMSVCPPHILMHFLESASFSCVWITPNPMLFSSLLSFPASEIPLLLLRLFFPPITLSYLQSQYGPSLSIFFFSVAFSSSPFSNCVSFVKWDLGQTARANTKGSISCTTTDLSICQHVRLVVYI